jgi:hypothetical protein
MTLKWTSKIFLLTLIIFGMLSSQLATKPIEAYNSILYSNTLADSKINKKVNSALELNDHFQKYKKVSLQTPSNNNLDHSEMISAIKEAEKRKMNASLSLPVTGPWKAQSGTLNSVIEIHTDVNQKHDIILILPDTGKLYEGVLAYSATTDVQPVTFIGPVSIIDDKKGQLISSMDGGNKWYAVSAKEADQKIGTWQFAGNAIAVHTTSETPFIGNYTVVYRELNPSETNKAETITSTPSQVFENNTGQISWILPPSPKYNTGTISYSSSDNIQFLTFDGPLKVEEEKGKKNIWSPDNGKTKYEITLIDLGNKTGILTSGKMGTFTFGENGLAIHSYGEKPITTSYALVTH